MKLVVVLFLSLLAGFTAIMRAEEWPKGYVIHEGSISLDKRFGILVPDIATVENDENPGEINYLANLEKHILLGTINGARYWEHGNHVGLTAQWAPDSSVCIPTYEARFGFYSVSALLVRHDGSAFRQLKFGATIQEKLDQIIRQTSKGTVSRCEIELFTRIDRGMVRVGALGQNNPKALDDIVTFYGYFHGTYDIKSGKWSDAAAMPLSEEQNEWIGAALLDQSDVSESAETEADHLDKILNQVYRAIRLVLPAKRFSQVKLEQITWLKERDAASDITTKSRIVRARIDALRKLIW